MRKIGANYIITNTGQCLKNAYLEIDAQNTITNIVYNDGVLKEVAGLEFYNGVLVPGFVNTHCHLELSYLKDKIPTKKGLANFIKHIQKLKSQSTVESIQEALQAADKKMWQEGIVAVGDISNTADSLACKAESPIQYHTFIELFALDPSRAESVFNNGLELKDLFEEKQQRCSLVPHAPYSVSEELFKLIRSAYTSKKTVLSIHNQETESENSFFQNHTGALYEMFKTMPFDMSGHKATGKTSLPSIMPQLPQRQNIILVHNTFTKPTDIAQAQSYETNIYWSICCKANLYIEDRMPPVDLLHQKQQNICIGTDSLASNNQLSILDELKTIQNHFPDIPFETLILWATLNGAKALGLEHQLGSFEIGKAPGINLIKAFDFEHFKLQDNSKCINLLSN